MAKIPVNGQSYSAWSLDVNAQRTVNWYVEMDPTGKNNIILYPMPGLSIGTVSSTFVDPIRAMHIGPDGHLYFVSGDAFGRVNSGGGTLYIGVLATSSGRCEIADNGTEIIVVDGQKGYLYNTVTTAWYDDIYDDLDLDFPNGANTVSFLDGYFIVNDPNNTNGSGYPGGFFISGLYDGTTWAALDYEIAGRDSDQIVKIAEISGQLWLIKSKSIEVWYNSGNAIFPFERINSAVITQGTIAPASVAEYNNSLLFVSQSSSGRGEVVMSNGYTLAKISNQALDTEIQGYSTLSDARAYIFQYHGHTFYVLTFPTANKTWVFDLSNGSWTEWSTDGVDNRHISNAYAYFRGQHWVGSSEDGKFYILRSAVYDDNGTAITRMRQTPHIHNNDKALFGSALTLKFEQGVGNGSFPNPQVMLQWSDDGGHTWSSEHWRPILGAVGEYDSPSTWRRLGKWYDRIFRIKVTDGVKPVLIDGYLDVDLGDDEVKKD